MSEYTFTETAVTLGLPVQRDADGTPYVAFPSERGGDAFTFYELVRPRAYPPMYDARRRLYVVYERRY